MRLSAKEFVKFIANSVLPVPEAASVFKPDAVPPFEEIITVAERAMCDGWRNEERVSEIIQWAKESQV